MTLQKLAPEEARVEIDKAIKAIKKDARDNGVKMYKHQEHYEDVPGVYRLVETEEHKRMRLDIMKAAIAPKIIDLMEKTRPDLLSKTTLNIAANMTPYDLMAPAKTLVPWLTPLVESTPRIHRSTPGALAHWKTIINTASSFSRGGAPAMAWINEGQRAPLLALNLSNQSATYASLGTDVNVTYEAESASIGFEDAVAASHFFALETLRVKEEEALVGGNNSLKLGTANTPVGAVTASSGAASSGTYYAAVVGLTYEGYRNSVLAYGTSPSSIVQTQAITTLDNKTMTVNYGCGIASAVSSVSSGSSVVVNFTVTPKNGEIAYAWYLGTTASSTSSLYFQGITTVPAFTYSASSAPSTSSQPLSALTATDYSVNDGTTGGGTNQVTAFDGFLTQAWNNNNITPQNAYTVNLKNTAMTTGGSGNVVEIDTMLRSMWDNYKVTVDVIYVAAQEMASITKLVLNSASAPLLRYYPKDGQDFDLTGSGVISFYFNPYIPGGRKIPIIIHPTLPNGTILAFGKTLPQYFKANNTANIAEVLCRRDYYTEEWAKVTREYQSGVYAEEVLAVYAPFAIGIINGIKAS